MSEGKNEITNKSCAIFDQMAINKRFYRKKEKIIEINSSIRMLLTVHDIWVCYLHRYNLYLMDNPMGTNENSLALSFVHRVHPLYHFYRYIYDHLLLLYKYHSYRMDLDCMYEVDLLNYFIWNTKNRQDIFT